MSLLRSAAAIRPGPHPRARARGGHAGQPRGLPLRRHHRPRDRPAGAPPVRLDARAVRAGAPGPRPAHRDPAQPEARDFLISKTMDVVPSEPLARGSATLPADADRGDADRGDARRRAARSRGRSTRRASPFRRCPICSSPATSGWSSGEHVVVGLDALRRPLDRGAADQGALPSSIPSSPTPGCSTTGRRSGAATTRSRAATCTTCGPTCWCSASASGPRRRRSTSSARRCSSAALVTDVLVVVMPKAPTAIHLDMIFTQVDRELCVVYPPFFVGPERLAGAAPAEGPDGVQEMPDFFAALAGVGCRWSRSSPAASGAPARSGSSGARRATSWRCARARS